MHVFFQYNIGFIMPSNRLVAMVGLLVNSLFRHCCVTEYSALASSVLEEILCAIFGKEATWCGVEMCLCWPE